MAIELRGLRARIKGGCGRCKDGGLVEVAGEPDASCYMECVYCKWYLTITLPDVFQQLRRAMSEFEKHPPEQKAVSKALEEWADEALAPRKKKKKKKSSTESPTTKKVSKKFKMPGKKKKKKKKFKKGFLE